MALIGFTGKKQSGKTTATMYLKLEHDALHSNFKDALIEEIKKNFPNLLEVIKDSLEETTFDSWSTNRLFGEKPPLIRTLMQNYGTNVRRNDSDTYWVDKWTEKVSPLVNEHFIIADDVRFLNEAQAVRDLGGKIIRIERSDMVSHDTHLSEMEMDKIEPDHTITVGSGEFENLYKQLDKLV